MQGFMKNILRTAAALALCVLSACVYEEQDEPELTGDYSLLNISLSLPMTLAETGETSGYVPGEGYENYIDIKNRGYRIYFFDSVDRYVARFTPMLITSSDSKENTYDVLGRATDDIAGLSNFKIVVLANWPSYPDAGLQRGVSTIDDLCSDAAAKFDRLSSFELDPDKGLTIPFFGVHHYTGVTIEKGKLTTLAEPVALLRAMAKIEVVVNIDGATLSSIGLRGFNAEGYCAPAGVHSQSDYDHSGNWDLDYVKTPHLVGGANDADAANAFVPLLHKAASGAKQEMWIAYVPEYSNLNADSYKSRLELKLDVQSDEAVPYDIYFADYDANGKMVADSYFDILRNNCYRFTVTIERGDLVIKVKKWENAYDNKFVFD